MGYSRWDDSDWKSYSAVTTRSTREEIFSNRNIFENFNPQKVVLRESRDSELNPLSTPLIFGLDVTGSMGIIAEKMAKEGLGALVNGILDRVPVTDPHIMIMGVGDASCDSGPLQVTQFESDIRIAEQLSNIWLEGGGGGNSYESYDLPWYFAANKTSTDAWEKRGKKGYLFTIGDELPPPGVSGYDLKKVFGKGEWPSQVSATESLADAQEKYEVFHVIVEQGDFCRRNKEEVTSKWKRILDRRAIRLSDYNYISQVIISAIEVSEGRDPIDVINSWELPDVKVAVRYALEI